MNSSPPIDGVKARSCGNLIKALLWGLVVSMSMVANAQSVLPKKGALNLLDDKLSYWYKWLGNPHKSVVGLPEGTPTGDGMNGPPLGLSDPKHVFSVISLKGEKVLKVTGEIYGGLTTKIPYENYHLHLQYKWGSKKWEPRLVLPRDMGIMFHLTGTNEDAFWSVFMMGIECQISEKSSADLFLVPNKTFNVFPVADVRVDKLDNVYRWDVNAPMIRMGGVLEKISANRSQNFESDSTQWTTMDLYTVGSSAVYLVNGQVVMAFQKAGLLQPDKSVTPLTKGKIQLQSEGAEGYYKDITIQSITDFPAAVKKAAGLEPAQNWKLGVALYSFHKFTFPDELAKADSAGLAYVEGFTFGKAGVALKDSLISRLSPSGLDSLLAMVRKRGLLMESIYVTGGRTVGQWKKDFELAKRLHVKYVTAEPATNMWDSVDSLAGVYGIKVAIHNHWKGASAYWSPDSVLAAIKNHPNFGACPDLGHYPKSGINPVEALKKLEGHIIGIHLKDIAAYNNPNLQDVPLGKGVIDFKAVFAELKRQQYSGYLIIERDAEDKPSNLPSIEQTVSYYRQALDLLPAKK